MDIFVVIQPILDRRQDVYAYRLLCRQSEEKRNGFVSSDRISSRVLTNLLESNARRAFTNHMPAFISFTREQFLDGAAFISSGGDLVPEVRESGALGEELLVKCRALHDAGYTLALRVVEDRPESAPILEIADILTVDFLTANPEFINMVARRYKAEKVLLADKIETAEDFERAKRLGYMLFQGYFFSRSAAAAHTELTPLKTAYLKLLKLCNNRMLDFKEISRVIGSDVALTLKLLRVVNSCAFPHRSRINNVRMAVSYLGETMIRRWISLIALSDLSADKPGELIRLLLVRAKFGENIANLFDEFFDENDLFLLGMFSLLNVVAEMDFDTLLGDLAISDDIREALIYNEGKYADFLPFFEACEHADWNRIQAFAQKRSIGLAALGSAYMDALAWYADFARDFADDSHDSEYIKANRRRIKTTRSSPDLHHAH